MLKSGQPIQTTGSNLVGLWRPSFVKVDHRLFVYGGGGNVTNDLHVLNLCDMRWETIQTVKGIAPCKRYGHTANLWKHYIIVFGGCNELQAYCNDIHIFDLEKLTWCQPETNGSVSARYLHSAVVHDDKLFVYGGFAKNTDCTYVLDEISVLDLNTLTWSIFHRVPPRYNHSATLVGHKMYIFAGKDEQGNTVSDLFVVNLNTPPYTPHVILSGAQSNSQMVPLKSQHFCEAVCGKLLVFGRYVNPHHPRLTNMNSTSSTSNHHQHQHQQQQQQHQQLQQHNNNNNNNTNNNIPDSMYGLWMLDLDTLEWQPQDCNASFEVGGWNYFTVITENLRPNGASSTDEQSQVAINSLFFLGNTDPFRPQGYDHFRDALVINGESLGLYDIPPLQCANEFSQLLNNPELSDFVIVTSSGQELHVHQVILITRWPHFRNMYRSGMMEAQQRRMEISEPFPVVLAFLKYLYSDHLSLDEPWQVVCDILVMANMYLLHRLKKICCQRLYGRHLTIDSCTTIFEKAIMAEEMGLKLLALDFMFNHYGAVLKADLLHQMSSFARQEFLECVPDDAILHVGKSSRFQSFNNTTASRIPATTMTTTNLMTTVSANANRALSSSSSSISSTSTNDHTGGSSSGDDGSNNNNNSNSVNNNSDISTSSALTVPSLIMAANSSDISSSLSTSTSSSSNSSSSLSSTSSALQHSTSMPPPHVWNQSSPFSFHNLSSTNHTSLHMRSTNSVQTDSMMATSQSNQRLSSTNGMAVGV